MGNKAVGAKLFSSRLKKQKLAGKNDSKVSIASNLKKQHYFCNFNNRISRMHLLISMYLLPQKMDLVYLLAVALRF